jgi:hypothetical protein
MKNKILSLLAATLVIGFTSCKTTDDENPVITLSTPVSEQDFEIGDTIFIHGDITDNESLHEIEIKLTKQETGEIPFDFQKHLDAESYHIDTFYIPTDTIHIHYHLKVEAWDHDDNKAELEYTLHWAD